MTRRTARWQPVGPDDDVGAVGLGQHLLMGVPGADDDLHVGDVAAQAGDRGEAHRAGAEHGHHCGAAGVLAGGDDGSGEQRRVDAAGERFDEHGTFVGHVADAMEL